MQKNKLIRFSGFTLAEVLLTLAIIGVVAALTVPSLLLKMEEDSIKIRWKKAYSTLNQAYSMAVTENSGTLAGACTNAKCFSDLLKPYLKMTKTCDSGNVDDCWNIAYSPFEQPAYAVPIVFDPYEETPEYASVVLDGMVLGYYFVSQNCDDASQTGVPECAIITVDIDGPKGKHIAGKDLFAIHLQANTIKPFGVKGDYFEDRCVYYDDNTFNYKGCPAKFLYGDKVKFSEDNAEE